MALVPALLLFFFFATAQESPRVLLMDEVVKQATENNRNITLAVMDEKISQSNYKETSVIFLPQVNFSYTAATTNNPLYAFGFKLQQESITEADFNPKVLNNPSGTVGFHDETGSTAAPCSIWIYIICVKAQPSKLNYLIIKHKEQKNISSSRQNRPTWNYNWPMNQKRFWKRRWKQAGPCISSPATGFRQGLLQKSDILNSDVQIKTIESNLEEADNSIKNISDLLSQLMNTEKGAVYMTEPLTPTSGKCKIRQSAC